ncbi:hypothetical protein AALP_AA5G280700 [Arabis alpina]|uniref:F-box domain-containing protein n=1 Tax=Arabis alpina TaxID=50452 RepID=A0A087GZV5_ARAAL|nr:hypothetical protein AALP_AA5G280700 [Arabis alpina]
MDSRNLTRLSCLPDVLLVLIISNLRFKEAVKTSVLAKRWKNLYRETTKVSFKESDFVKISVSDNEEAKNEVRVSFVRYMVDWVSSFPGEAIESFEVSLSKPVAFETEINSLIGFVVSKKVKNLVLDFSEPSWTTSNQVCVFPLPECVYNLATLESLKLFACGFIPSRFSNIGSMKSLCFGWIQLGKIMSLIKKSPLLESLTIQNCWNVGLDMISRDNNRLTELIFENCDFATEYSTLDVANIQIFKYIGKFHYFQFMEENKNINEAYLDYGAETEYDDATGTYLCGLLYDLKSAKKLTVCQFLTQLIKDDDPVRLQAPMETKDLVMKTNLQPSEFVGIRLMINSCPDLETITFVMVPPTPVSSMPLGFEPDEYWTVKLSHKCLKSTLKVVEVKNFSGGLRECQVLQYLIRYGRVLERVDMYLSSELDDGHKILAHTAARMIGTMFVKGSSRVRILLHNV